MPPGRTSNRLTGYDYAQPGAYFVTVRTYRCQLLFGEIAESVFIPNNLGKIVEEELLRSEFIRKEIELDEWVVMPNHLHAIVWIHPSHAKSSPPVGAHGRAPLRRQPQSLGSFIAGLKASSTKRINQARSSPGAAVWQRNYFDRIVRNERELDRLRRYILANPLRWEFDRYHMA